MKQMKKLDETHFLIKVSVLHDGTGSWTFQWNKGYHVHRGDVESLAHVLRRIHAKDNQIQPRSMRSMTYLEIAEEITSGVDTIIYVWENHLKLLK